MCDGQTGYTVSKLDALINKIVHDIFAQMKDVPKDAVIIERYTQQIAEYQEQIRSLKVSLQAQTAEALEYESEVIKIIRGESKLNPDLLNKLIQWHSTRLFLPVCAAKHAVAVACPAGSLINPTTRIGRRDNAQKN